MKTQGNAWQEALNSSEHFLTFLAQHARAETFHAQKCAREADPHPARELLHDFVWGELAPEHARSIRLHLAFCATCLRTVMHLEAIQTAAAAQLGQWANAVAAPSVLADETDLRDVLASEIWTPAGAGEALVAASAAVTQTQEFQTAAGRVTITCAWGPHVELEPAFIWLAWQTDMPPEHQFVIRLIEPETGAIRYEVRPGAFRQGDQTFPQDVLGFDPVSQKWALAVVVSAVTA